MLIKPKQTTAGTFQLWLDGAEDLLAVWNLPPHRNDVQQWNNQRSAMSESYASHFYGAASEQEARQVLLNGWPAGMEIVTALASKIEEKMPPPASRRRTRKWNEDGDEVSYERWQAGLEAWNSSHRKLRSSCGLVELVCGWGSGCGSSVEQLKWSGAAALALTTLLENADYSVELSLVAAMFHRANANVSLVKVLLKDMGVAIDVEKLAAVAVYPAAWRIYGLCAFQQSPFGSGNQFDSHPHSAFHYHAPDGMWAYRPNVLTVTLNESGNEAHAISNVLESLKQLESLVNPQDHEEISNDNAQA
jgi:hypothetical protein